MLGGDTDSGSGGGTGVGLGGDVQDRYGDGYGYGQLTRWEDTVIKVILGTEPNAPFAYAIGFERHHLIMSMLGGHGGRLDRERDVKVINLD